MKKYELINGVFEWAEAREILIHIILKKIQFHKILEEIQNSARNSSEKYNLKKFQEKLKNLSRNSSKKLNFKIFKK